MFALCVGIVVPHQVQAEEATSESDFTWDGNTITKYTGTDTTVVIPERATAIGRQAPIRILRSAAKRQPTMRRKAIREISTAVNVKHW